MYRESLPYENTEIDFLDIPIQIFSGDKMRMNFFRNVINDRDGLERLERVYSKMKLNLGDSGIAKRIFSNLCVSRSIDSPNIGLERSNLANAIRKGCSGKGDSGLLSDLESMRISCIASKEYSDAHKLGCMIEKVLDRTMDESLYCEYLLCQGCCAENHTL